ncbi:MAG: cysteine hydrolase [Rhodobacteraceae bacterium]|nr:cysteine hydrolase [Paracoccaceae bacterium]
MIAWVLAGLITLPILWLGFGIWQIGRVSAGARIPERSGTAVLMIDLQTVFWRDGPYGAADKARIEAAVRAHVAAAKRAGYPIIALRQEWSQPATRAVARVMMRGKAIAGTPGTELAAPFQGLADHELVKRVQDGFETGALDPLLADLDVGQLRIMGLDGEYCVARTAIAALARGYEVALCVDAIATARPGKQDAVLARLTAMGATVCDASAGARGCR